MVKLRITDFGGSETIFETSESADEFNNRIDHAFNSRNYFIRLTGFLRYDVRNMAKIEEVKEQPQQDEPEEPTEESEQPNEPIEEPSDDPTEEPIEG